MDRLIVLWHRFNFLQEANKIKKIRKSHFVDLLGWQELAQDKLILIDRSRSSAEVISDFEMTCRCSR